jgi:hypothetical protein
VVKKGGAGARTCWLLFQITFTYCHSNCLLFAQAVLAALKLLWTRTIYLYFTFQKKIIVFTM